MAVAKPKVAVYWAAACGGCEIAFVNIHEKLLDFDANFELAFCPCLMDAKRADVEAMPDASLAVTLFDGAIRTGENEEMAHLLRRKSQVLIACGACACGGGVPALANLKPVEDLFALYDSPSADASARVLPQTRTVVGGIELELPALCRRIRPLSEIVDVDYFLPGCPPESEQIANVIQLLIDQAPLPPKGSTVGAGRSSVCTQCARKPTGATVAAVARPRDARPDSRCLLEQGLLCMGPATRDGCGAGCPSVGIPCTGCYGPSEGVADQGARMAGAVGALFEIASLQDLSHDDLHRAVKERIASLPDWAGTFYKFSLASSLLGRLGGKR